MTWKQETNFRNGFLAPINIQIVVLHVDVVLIGPKISHYLFQITGFGGHIEFCTYRPPGGYPNLYAVVFENITPIPNTIPNCKNLSPSAQFAWKSGYSHPANIGHTHATDSCCCYTHATDSCPVWDISMTWSNILKPPFLWVCFFDDRTCVTYYSHFGIQQWNSGNKHVLE